MTIHHWNNHKVEVKSHTLPKFLWSVVSYSITVDDKEVFHGPTSMGIKETISFKIYENDNVFDGKIKTLVPAAAIYTRYKLIIDNEEIEKKGVTADNWYMIYGIFVLTIIGITFL